MINREKVIKELEDYEPYAKVFTNLTVKGQVILDAIAVLKEQQKLLDEITQRRANNGAFD